MSHEHKPQKGPRHSIITGLVCPVCGVETSGHTHDYIFSLEPHRRLSGYWVLRPCGHKAVMDYDAGELREWKP